MPTTAGDASAEMKHSFTDYGVLINSGDWGGKLSEVAIAEMAAVCEAERIWRSCRYVSHSRLGCVTSAILGRACAGGLLRQVRDGAGAVRAIAGCVTDKQRISREPASRRWRECRSL